MFNTLVSKTQARVNSFRSEEGATAVEYGILVGAIAVVVAAAALLLGPAITTALGNITTAL